MFTIVVVYVCVDGEAKINSMRESDKCVQERMNNKLYLT